MAGIRFENVVKRFGSTEVIRNLNLEIFDGEFIVLVGPSGCAKSTTLRMIAGLESLSDGRLWIGDREASGLSPKDRNVAMVFQSYALFPTMSVRGNLSFGMNIRKEPKAKVKTEVDRVAGLLGLDLLLDRRPSELSGGQAQRVALGRAMIRHPDAYLFDEPLSNLDAELRVQMRGEISNLQRELKVTTVYVTHDQTEAMTMGDRVAVMRLGEIMQVASPMELYQDPDNAFVAGFIGSPKMNFLDAVVSDGMLRLHGGAKIDASTLMNGVGQSTELQLGIRPESVLLPDASQDVSGIHLTGLVTLVEALGHETLIHVKIDGDLGTTLCARTKGGHSSRVRPNAQLELVLPTQSLYVFDAKSGQRLRFRT